MASGHDSQLGDLVLLAKMNKLRENGISEYIRLSQVRLPGSSNRQDPDAPVNSLLWSVINPAWYFWDGRKLEDNLGRYSITPRVSSDSVVEGEVSHDVPLLNKEVLLGNMRLETAGDVAFCRYWLHVVICQSPPC